MLVFMISGTLYGRRSRLLEEVLANQMFMLETQDFSEFEDQYQMSEKKPHLA